VIGAVFDAAVREGWGYLGELASQPMFSAAEWDRIRESDFRGNSLPELRLVKRL
jgi:hypothetical protein